MSAPDQPAIVRPATRRRTMLMWPLTALLLLAGCAGAEGARTRARTSCSGAFRRCVLSGATARRP